MDAKELIVTLRFKVAAIRQLLRDRGKEMTDEQRDILFDDMNQFMTIIEELERTSTND